MITSEKLKIANDMIKPVNIKGKEYAQVTERIKAFRAICPGGRISTEIVTMENGVVTMQATVIDEEGNVIASGLAQEKEQSSFINKTSYIENCETSAVGRALGFAGIGVDGSMASAEEVANAIINQGGGYPSRSEMMKVIDRKYPEGSDNRRALMKSFSVDDLKKASDEQIKAVYSKVTR